MTTENNTNNNNSQNPAPAQGYNNRPQQGFGGGFNGPRGGSRFGGNQRDQRGGHGRGPGRGAPVREKSPYDSKILDIGRVTRVTKGGKQLSFRAVIVLGDRKGKIAIATGKGKDVAQAVDKATRIAKKKFFTVPMISGTIPHEVFAKYGAARVMLKPQKGGRGIIAGGATRVVCSLAGIENITAKISGTTKNKLSNAMATLEAFKKLKPGKESKATKEAPKMQTEAERESANDPSRPRLVKKQK
jgi:small subunit ribosomal protein S5